VALYGDDAKEAEATVDTTAQGEMPNRG